MINMKIEFINEECRRGCGTMLTTLRKSIYGLEQLKIKYELICKRCLTENEKQEMLYEILGSINV